VNFTLVSKETRCITKSVRHADVIGKTAEKVLGKETHNQTLIQKKAFVN